MAETETPLEAALSPLEAAAAAGSEITEGVIGSATTDNALVAETPDEDENAPVPAGLNEAKEKAMRAAYLSNPEVQAEIIFRHYVNSSNRPLSGQQKRTLRREILRNAKKGRYAKMFTEEALSKQESKNDENFGKLNSPA